MPTIYKDGHSYEMSVELIDVTSMSRPDESWRYICQGGGMHAWYEGQAPASRYSPTARYHLPTLRWVKDGVGYYDDGEPYDIGHHECAQCGEHIAPRYTADQYTVYVQGLKHYRIDGELVSEDEFMRRVKEATS